MRWITCDAFLKRVWIFLSLSLSVTTCNLVDCVYVFWPARRPATQFEWKVPCTIAHLSKGQMLTNRPEVSDGNDNKSVHTIGLSNPSVRHIIWWVQAFHLVSLMLAEWITKQKTQTFEIQTNIRYTKKTKQIPAAATDGWNWWSTPNKRIRNCLRIQ